jgi:hypothetical protein
MKRLQDLYEKTTEIGNFFDKKGTEAILLLRVLISIFVSAALQTTRFPSDSFPRLEK